MKDGVAALIVGNEVLTAKVVDENGPYLTRRLRDRGLPLRLLMIVPDEVDAIVEAIGIARNVAPYVLTSGGIGPTHDDVTVRAVALALGRPVVRIPALVDAIHAHYGARTTPESLRLADAPQGAELIVRDGAWYPVLSCEGVFLLPGVPQLFRLQLETVLQRLPGVPVFVKNLFLSLGEPELAATLDQVALSHPDVAIGSYPRFEPELDYRVKVTIEGGDLDRVERVAAEVLARLPASALVRSALEVPSKTDR